MKIESKHIGAIGSEASGIIEITVTDFNGDSSITESVTSLNGYVDADFIASLREIANELEEQNFKLF